MEEKAQRALFYLLVVLPIKLFFKLSILLVKLLVKFSVWFAIWSRKSAWPALMFTGLWLPILILVLDVLLQPFGVPGDVWGIPFLMGLGFAAFWTGRNYLARRSTPQAQQQPQAGQTQASAAPKETGVFFGIQGKNKPMTKPLGADGHVLVVGGAGSGKTSCIAIPTLRDTWHAPALVVDIKGELMSASTRPRALVFNPLNQAALGYDPFYLLHNSDNPVPDIREIALTLCPLSASASVKDPFWIQAAQTILTGHLLYSYKRGKSFLEAVRLLQSSDAQSLLELESKDLDAAMYIRQFVNAPEQTLSSIMMEVSNKVVPFATDPHIQATLSKKEIVTPQLLEQGYDVFLQIPEYKLEQWKALVSLVVQQFSRHFEQRPDYQARPILFLLDEFPRLGRMDAVVSGLATLRSKKITIMPIIQSLAQLDATYGQDNRKIICDNCSYKAILGATDADSQKYFSALVGTEEREKISRSVSGAGISFANFVQGSHASTSTSYSTEEKPIIKPEEFAYLKDIVLLTPQGYMRVEKRPYYLTAPVQSVPVPQQGGALPPYQAGYPARAAGAPPVPQQLPPVPLPQPTLVAAAMPQPPDGGTSLYEMPLRQMLGQAPLGTRLETIADQFYASLSPAEQAGFRQYWQGKEQQTRNAPDKHTTCQAILAGIPPLLPVPKAVSPPLSTPPTPQQQPGEPEEDDLFVFLPQVEVQPEPGEPKPEPQPQQPEQEQPKTEPAPQPAEQPVSLLDDIRKEYAIAPPYQRKKGQPKP